RGVRPGDGALLLLRAHPARPPEGRRAVPAAPDDPARPPPRGGPRRPRARAARAAGGAPGAPREPRAAPREAGAPHPVDAVPLVPEHVRVGPRGIRRGALREALADATLSLLFLTSVATALFHTLIPAHWLPFVLIGRARGWSLGTTAAVSGISALLHTGLSIVLALVALAIGLRTAHAGGVMLERASGVLLLAFGGIYALWAWRKGGHFHPGGALLHGHAHEDCDGREGDLGQDHLHYHADTDLIHGRARRSALWLPADA